MLQPNIQILAPRRRNCVTLVSHLTSQNCCLLFPKVGTIRLFHRVVVSIWWHREVERPVKHLIQDLPGSQPLLRSCPHGYRKPASRVLNLMLRFPQHPHPLPKGLFPQDLMKPSLVLSSCHNVIPPVQDLPHRWDSFRGCLWCKGPGAAVSSHQTPLPTLAGHEQALSQLPRNVRNE